MERILKDEGDYVKKGEILALVGMSGGGKTSLVNLIPRLYDATGGSVRIAGVDVKEFSVKSLRDHIAIVTQEPILFNDTIRNNIAYGNQNATEDDILDAAKAAYAYDFIESFPKGFDTVIGELGGRLSGGEKQRLCIARALLKNAPILILDEATSALDSGTEREIQANLKELSRGRTTISIAHRLSTIQNVDRIYLVEGGQVVRWVPTTSCWPAAGGTRNCTPCSSSGSGLSGSDSPKKMKMISVPGIINGGYTSMARKNTNGVTFVDRLYMII